MRRGNGEGTITHRADGRWMASITVWRDGKRMRKSAYAPTRNEAAKKLRTLLQDRDRGELVTDERQTVSQYLAWWLDHIVDTSTRAETTKASYRWIVSHYLEPAIGHVRLTRLDARHIQQLMSGLQARGLSPRSCQYAHTVLRNALATAVKWDQLPRNPATLVDAPRPTTDPTKVRALSVDEARLLLKAVTDDRLNALYVLAVAVGLRRGEALGLRWSDLDLDAGTLRVEQQVQRVNGKTIIKALPKTASSRRLIVLPDFCVDALRHHSARQDTERAVARDEWDERGLIFTTRTGRPIEPRNFTRHFHAACDRAGIARTRFHNLRHTTASFLLANDVPMRVVQEVLGHSSIQITADLYTHVAPVMLRQAADQIANILGQSA